MGGLPDELNLAADSARVAIAAVAGVASMIPGALWVRLRRRSWRSAAWSTVALHICLSLAWAVPSYGAVRLLGLEGWLATVMFAGAWALGIAVIGRVLVGWVYPWYFDCPQCKHAVASMVRWQCGECKSENSRFPLVARCGSCRRKPRSVVCNFCGHAFSTTTASADATHAAVILQGQRPTDVAAGDPASIRREELAAAEHTRSLAVIKLATAIQTQRLEEITNPPKRPTPEALRAERADWVKHRMHDVFEGCKTLADLRVRKRQLREELLARTDLSEEDRHSLVEVLDRQCDHLEFEIGNPPKMQ